MDYEKLAKDAYADSTSYFDANYRSKIEDAIRMFHSQHTKSSKYNSDAYRYRSRLFRPKSRSVVRKHEATAARAFFSNLDVVSVSPQDGDNPEEVASAIINKELLQYRLTKTIPWFLNVIGGFQDAMKTGVVASFQYWNYQSRMVEEEVDGVDPETGATVKVRQTVEEITKDEPCVELLPIERVRFSPNAKWFDVVNTSPYLILEIPMFAYEVKARWQTNDYGPKWYECTDAELRTAGTEYQTSTEEARRQAEVPTANSPKPLNEYDLVQVHLNFMKGPDGVKVYYTLKDKKLLSKPVPLKEMFFHDKVPVTIGFCVIDTHNIMPDGLIDLGKMLQTETNEIANQRIDNVKLVLNKRWLVKRNSNVDTDSLMRNVPGGVTMVGNTSSDGGDIREVNWQDVTSSSYQEQDRVNVDYDDLTGGGINSSSVMSNRQLNETVGGMRMMAQGANDLTEYTIRTLVETWVEPVLRQLMLLEQYYESDETVLALAGKRAQLWQHFGTDKVTDELLIRELNLTVNVGMGATDSDQRLQKFMMATGAWNQMGPMLPPDANPEEIKKELFGLAGYRDASRFYSGKGDPRVQQLQQTVQQLQQQLQMFQMKDMDHSADRQTKVQIAGMNNQTKLQVAQSGGEDPNLRLMEMASEQRREDAQFAHQATLDQQRFHFDVALQADRHNSTKKLDRERTAADIDRQQFKTMHEVQQGYQKIQQQAKTTPGNGTNRMVQ